MPMPQYFSMSAEASIQVILSRLTFLWQRDDISATSEYISSLGPQFLSEPRIATAVATFFSDNCNFNQALEVVQKSQGSAKSAEYSPPNDIISATLTLITAHIEVHHDFRFAKAVQSMEHISRIYVNPNIAINNRGRTRNDDDISDNRLYLEYWILKIASEALQNGTTSLETVRARHLDRFEAICNFLSDQASHSWLYRFLKLFELDQVFGCTVAGKLVARYLQKIDRKEHPIEYDNILLLLSTIEYGKDKSLAEKYLSRVMTTFEEQHCTTSTFQQYWYSLVNLTIFQSSTDSLSDCLDTVVQLGQQTLEKGLLTLCSYATSFVLVQEDLTGIRSKSTQTLVQSLSVALLSNGDFENHRILQIACLRRLAKVLPEAWDARPSLEQILSSSDGILSPRTLADVCETLWLCCTSTNDLVSASLYAEREINSEYARLTPWRRSQAQDRAGHTKFQRAEQSLSLIRQSGDPGMKIEITVNIQAIRQDIAIIESWHEEDLRNGQGSSRLIKARQLARFYMLIKQLLPHDAEASILVKFWTQQGTADEDESIENLLPSILALANEGRNNEVFGVVRRIFIGAIQKPTCSVKLGEVLMSSVIATLPQVREETSQLLRAERHERAIANWHLAQYAFKLFKSAEVPQTLLLFLSPYIETLDAVIEFQPDKKAELVNMADKILAGIEVYSKQSRNQRMANKGINELLRVRQLVARSDFVRLYRDAATFFIFHREYEKAWSWLQKGRVRALLDILESHEESCDTLEKSVMNEVRMDSAVQSDDKISKERSAASVPNLKKRSASQQELIKYPVVRELIDGPRTPAMTSTILDDIWTLTDWLPKGTNIILVDWHITSSLRIILFTVDLQHRKFQVHPIAMTIEDVQKWISVYIQFPNGREKALEDPGALKDLCPLLTGLETVSCEDDLIILTPPRILARIPLHAIAVAIPGKKTKKPLVERNTVLYSSSITLYRECLSRSKAMKPAPPYEGVFIGTYDVTGSPKAKEAREEILKTVEDSAKLFQGRTISPDEVTKDTLKSTLQSSPWVSYLGHASYTPRDPLSQAFILSPRESSREQPGVSDSQASLNTAGWISRAAAAFTSLYDSWVTESKLENHNPINEEFDTLTAAEIFALKPGPRHPVVCAVACDFSVQDISIGDEPLGILTALFFAGASSVLGTLWPIPSDVGCQFHIKFYQALREQLDHSNSDAGVAMVLNISQAMRKAVRELREQNDEPYAWASFVLHGAGFFRTILECSNENVV